MSDPALDYLEACRLAGHRRWTLTNGETFHATAEACRFDQHGNPIVLTLRRHHAPGSPLDGQVELVPWVSILRYSERFDDEHFEGRS